jgi:hypothetical protein
MDLLNEKIEKENEKGNTVNKGSAGSEKTGEYSDRWSVRW